MPQDRYSYIFLHWIASYGTRQEVYLAQGMLFISIMVGHYPVAGRERRKRGAKSFLLVKGGEKKKRGLKIGALELSFTKKTNLSKYLATLLFSTVRCYLTSHSLYEA